MVIVAITAIIALSGTMCVLILGHAHRERKQAMLHRLEQYRRHE